jgi:hypothetical protein
MKLSELKNLTEYNTGKADSPLSISQLEELLKDSILLRCHITIGMVPTSQTGVGIVIYRHDFDKDYCIYILRERLSESICGYCTMKCVKDNIWQIMETQIFKKYQGKRLTTELYDRFISVERKKIINGDQLSPVAAKLWSALKRDKKCKKIYDKKLDNEYDFSQVGEKTTDGIEILAPENDIDRNPENIRFFYIAESKNELRENYNNEWSRHDENADYWAWLRKEKMYIPRGGYITAFQSEEGDE